MITPQRKLQLERLAESQYIKERKLTEKRRLREQQLRETYKAVKDKLYIDFIEKEHLTEWQNNGKDVKGVSIGGHCLYVPKIDQNHNLYESIKVLQGEKTEKNNRLRENLRAEELMRKYKPKDVATDALKECINLAAQNSIEDVVSPSGL